MGREVTEGCPVSPMWGGLGKGGDRQENQASTAGHVLWEHLGLGPGDSCASGRGALDDLPFLSEWELGGCLPVPLWGSGRAQIALTLLDRLLPA